MQSSFPTPKNRYFKAKDFQDNQVILTFKGWEKEANADIAAKGEKQGMSWKARLKFMLRYSYPKIAVDEAGEQIIDTDTGEPMINSNYDENFPKGYTIKYHFEEGVLTCGSLPLFNSFGIVQPKPGDKIGILRTGEGVETEWKVTKAKIAKDFSDAEFSGDPQVNHEVNDEDII